MKSGLEDRNNMERRGRFGANNRCLNEVRPGRPEQLPGLTVEHEQEVLVSMKSGLEDRNNDGVNAINARLLEVSMKSGLEDRNNRIVQGNEIHPATGSQ